MSIVQISKIQNRSGNLVDLPQLDEAELGWATDAKKLYIGKDSPNENVEVLTAYSNISFSQIDGAVGNLNITSPANGQVLASDGNNWVNKGGSAGGLITLGNISNITITGGGIGYTIETDGTGNLSWTPKGALVSYIQNITKANPAAGGAVVTTVDNHFFVDATRLTITNVPGMTQVNGNSFYANVQSSNSFTLCSDSALTANVDSSGYTTFPYTTVTSANTSAFVVGSSTSFTANIPIKFLGDSNLANWPGNSGINLATTYYIKTVVDGTHFSISTTPGGANLTLTTASGTGANVYGTDGRATSSTSGSGSGTVGGSNTMVQYNGGAGAFAGSANLVFDPSASSILTVTGNANVIGNINSTISVRAPNLISNVANGTPPLVVTSYTRVPNLSVTYANVSDFAVVTANTSATVHFPLIANSSSSGNLDARVNANLSYVPSTGNLIATLLTGTLTTAAQPNITSVGTLTSLTVSGNTTSGNFLGILANTTSDVRIPAAAGNINLSVNGNANILVVTGTGANITGTANVTGNIVGANVNAGNANVTGQLISTQATGTAPLAVSSTTRVANLNVDYANVSDFAVVTANTSATVHFPLIANSSASGNLNARVNANLSYVPSTGNLIATLLTGTLTTAAQTNITSVGTLTSLAVTGNIIASNVYANVGTIGASLLTGTLTTAAQPNITSLGTLTSLTVSGNANAANIRATTYRFAGVTTGIAAAGATQAFATPLVKEMNFVSAASPGTDGVILPATQAGMTIYITNQTAITVNVYPATSSKINALALNAAFALVGGATLAYIAANTTQWYTVGGTYA